MNDPNHRAGLSCLLEASEKCQATTWHWRAIGTVIVTLEDLGRSRARQLFLPGTGATFIDIEEIGTIAEGRF